MIEIKNLCKHYGHQNVFSNLSFHLPSTGFCLLVGKNGSGKSSLLSILAGRDTDYSGEFRYNQEKITKSNADFFANQFVSFLPQDSLVFEDENVLENVWLLSEKKNKAKAENYLRKVGLEDRKDQLASNLSTGEKQRLCLARVLYDLKDILLCDEITSNLDEENKQIILNILKEVSKNHLVLFATHDTLQEFKSFSPVLLVLDNEKISSSGLPSLCEKSQPLNLKKQSFSPFSSLYTQWKEDKKSHFFLFFVSFFFVVLTIFSGSLYNSFEIVSKGSIQQDHYQVLKDRESDLVYDSYLSSSPIFICDKQNGREGEELKIYDAIIPFLPQKVKLGTIGSVFCIPSQSYISENLKLISGRIPNKEGEIRISSYTSDLETKKDSTRKEIQIGQFSFSVVGIYEGKDPNKLRDRLKASNSPIQREFYKTYSFLSGSVFLYSNRFQNFTSAFPNTSFNRKIREKHQINKLETAFWEDYLLSDKNGKNIIHTLSHRFSSPMFYRIFLISYSAFVAIFLVSYWIRNKRRFLLKRYLGISRKVLNLNNFLLFSRTETLALLFGIVIGSLFVFLFSFFVSNRLISKITLPVLMVFPCSYLYCLIIAFCFIVLFFGTLNLLSPKSISRKLYEVKKK